MTDRQGFTAGNMGWERLWKSLEVEKSMTDFSTLLGKHFVFPTFHTASAATP
jgi:hypothetical protein